MKEELDRAMGDTAEYARQLGMPIEYCDVARLVLRFFEQFHTDHTVVNFSLRMIRPVVREMVEDCGTRGQYRDWRDG